MAFLPNFFILGAAKCGTTYLHQNLGALPEVCMSRPKEPLFFPCEYHHGKAFYKKHYFREWNGEKIIGESNHRNLYLPYTAERIYKFNPDARLIIMVRNPVERAFSHWKHAYYAGKENLGFDAAVRKDISRIQKGLCLNTPREIERNCALIQTNWLGIYRTYVDTGYYFIQIERFLQYFSREQIKVVLIEDLKKDPEDVFSGIQQFLGLIPQPPPAQLEKKRNPGGVILPYNLLGRLSNMNLARKIPHSWKSKVKSFLLRIKMESGINTKTRRLLLEHYKCHNDNLAAFLECDLSHWNRQ